ncbi:FAD-dependent oxidoreductase [Paenibacillus sp. 481]|uniref:FAD-dependent oxidoreductase n=1 Tax=Paenibacillus sp. 481 TaxID=2835869 RepID=UPI001E418591|nr:FAD-dependent oxidoreductase [Paenibacillus sp. 481]UHA72588.1 FAD-dependent oxidoreductase [Paenibacillus sp. 481]
MENLEADVVIIGGGLGGTIAAWTLAERGYRVLMTEETDWIGGQLTSQAVPPDEHPWIEEFGSTRSYRAFRHAVRNHYRDSNLILPEVAQHEKYVTQFNPGSGWVSRLCHEPRLAHEILLRMLAPHLKSGRLHIMVETIPVEADCEKDEVEHVVVRHLPSGCLTRLRGSFFVDATELGDLLPLAGIEHVVGAESAADTKEPHALPEANSRDIQSFTIVMALTMDEQHPDKGEMIPKPEMYDWWKKFRYPDSPYPLLNWWDIKPGTKAEYRKFVLLSDNWKDYPLWTYRRIINRKQFKPEVYPHDISLINWPQNDYSLKSLIESDYNERQRIIEEARQLSLSLLYWLQTEAPRHDSGFGYPNLSLRGDVLGTKDGLAKAPYIRESRRIRALYTITEGDVNKEIRQQQGLGIRRYEDSVGVGRYFLDLHMTTETRRTAYIPALPYEIPLSALLPIRVRNVLPACKNIGTTQITNGCYRLHPTEWNIGEAVGHLLAYALQHELTPHDIRFQREHLHAYQAELDAAGVERSWPFDGKEL